MNNDTYKLYQISKEYSIWPIAEKKFLDILYGVNDLNNKTQVFTEEIEGQLAGYISVKSKVIEDSLKGVLVFIFVDEKFRSRGIGDKLFNLAVDWFKSQGLAKIKFGALAGSYFWPAVPENLPDLLGFLKCKGFEIEDGPVDMYGEITNFTPPSGVYDTLSENGVTIEYASADSKESILQFSQENFPRWYEYYKIDLDAGRYDKVFFAHKGADVIAISELWVGDSNWDLLFESNVGGGGALGVSDKWRGKGIGLAMKSWGTEKLKEKGVKFVWISWTSSIGFYEKLGFKIWMRYSNARLKFD